jgi:glutamate synthase (NADPH/NADH) small chain
VQQACKCAQTVEQSAAALLITYGFDPLPFPKGRELAQVKVSSWDGVVVDDNQMTSVPGVFADGDLVRGPSLVVHAVRDARKAAGAIHGFLHGRQPKRPVMVEALPGNPAC